VTLHRSEIIGFTLQRKFGTIPQAYNSRSRRIPMHKLGEKSHGLVKLVVVETGQEIYKDRLDIECV
jgi:hypothetical protein